MRNAPPQPSKKVLPKKVGQSRARTKCLYTNVYIYSTAITQEELVVTVHMENCESWKPDVMNRTTLVLQLISTNHTEWTSSVWKVEEFPSMETMGLIAQSLLCRTQCVGWKHGLKMQTMSTQEASCLVSTTGLSRGGCWCSFFYRTHHAHKIWPS